MDSNTIKVLVVEDNPSFARVLTLFLEEDTTHQWDIKHSLSLAEAVLYLNKESFDVILTDLSFPTTSRNDVVKTLKEANPDIPIIVLSAYSDKKLIEQLSNQGAQKFIAKEDILPESFSKIVCSVISKKISYKAP